jgi:hypothetical protein
MEDDPVDLRQGVENLRVEAYIRSLEGDAAGAALCNRAADLFEGITVIRGEDS